MAGKAKPGFYLSVFVVIAALVGYGVYRYGGVSGSDEQGADIDLDKLNQAEADDADGITTVKEYSFTASEKLPEIKGTAAYKPMENNTVKFAINVWAGWAPIIYANGGKGPKKVWTTPSGKKFKVELVLIDNPVAMRDAFAAGEVHIGWATVDMLPLLLEGLWKDSRTRPRIFQQIDWSNGGDGIVARKGKVETVKDLRGKTIVLAQNSPSHYFALMTLVAAGIQPSEVNFKFTNDAFEAAPAFIQNKDIAAAVSWAPDIYKMSDRKDMKMLVDTTTANKLIADVWFARADFANENKDIVEGLVRGIFDSMIELEGDKAKQEVAKQMADLYSLPATETFEMLGDAHWTNFAENKDFFLNANNPTNFERTFENAYYVYRQIRAVSGRVSFDQVMDFSILKKLAKEPKYADQKNTYQVRFAPASASSVQAESGEILTKTVVIHFYPNSHEIYKKVTKTLNGKASEVLYDPKVDLTIEEIAKLASQYGAARIVIEGHTDSSMKGRIPSQLVVDLSTNRANSVKQGLVRKFKLDPNQFSVQGMGWERPSEADDPLNHAKNRRVEIKVYPLEAQ